MKRSIAIIIMCICMAMTLGACKKEGDMIETMISTIFSTENRNESQDHTNNGTVTDSDGHIGNEQRETTGPMSDMIPGTTADSVIDSQNDNVM